MWSVNDGLSGNLQKLARNLCGWFVLLEIYRKPAENLAETPWRFLKFSGQSDIDGPHGSFMHNFSYEIALVIQVFYVKGLEIFLTFSKSINLFKMSQYTLHRNRMKRAIYVIKVMLETIPK